MTLNMNHMLIYWSVILKLTTYMLKTRYSLLVKI